MTTNQQQIVSDEILHRCAERAPVYDRENRFFTEDFDELRHAGYLAIAVPDELGGGNLTLPEVCREQRRLAYHAPATALALNMHLYWTGVAADLWRSGDSSMEWLLQSAVSGEVFAAGHAESGNDMPVLYSTTKAERVSGGYRFTGRKSFCSLAPVWTFLGLHAMDTSHAESPKVVHAFMPRDTEDYHIKENWDVLGMRATQSHDTVLEGAFVPDKFIARVVSPGAAGMDLFVLAIFAWGLLGFANVYFGMAQRALDVSINGVKKKRSIALSRTYAHHPEYQRMIADMVIELESVEPHIDKIATDWANRVDYGASWPMKIVAAKYSSVEVCWRVIDTALEVAGGFGIFRSAGLERLFRDARLGRMHPANAMLTRELVAKTVLGIDVDERPRWG